MNVLELASGIWLGGGAVVLTVYILATIGENINRGRSWYKGLLPGRE